MKDVSVRLSHHIWTIIKKLAIKDRRTVKATIETLAIEKILSPEKELKRD